MVLTAFPQPLTGPQLKAERERLGVRQKDLAARLGIKRGQLYLWEVGEVTIDLIRSTRYLHALAELTGDAIAEATGDVA